MNFQDKIINEGLTYDDVLLIPNYSEVLPREVSITSHFTRNITLNVPIISAAMDTDRKSTRLNPVTIESRMPSSA